MIFTKVLLGVLASFLINPVWTSSNWFNNSAVISGANRISRTDVILENLSDLRIDFQKIIYLDYNGGTSSSTKTSERIEFLDKKYFPFDLQKAGQVFHGWEYNGVRVFNSRGDLVNHVVLVNGMTFKAIFNNEVEINIAADGDKYIYENVFYNSEIYEYFDGPSPYVTKLASEDDTLRPGDQVYFSDSLFNIFGEHLPAELNWYINDVLISDDQSFEYVLGYEDLYVVEKVTTIPYYLTLICNYNDWGEMVVHAHETYGVDLISSPADHKPFYYYYNELIDFSLTITPNEGYEFVGLYYEEEFLEPIDNSYFIYKTRDDESLFIPDDWFMEVVAEDEIWFYACFAEVGATLTYDLNGGTKHDESRYPQTYFDFEGTIELDEPTKANCTFVGWEILETGEIVKTLNVSRGKSFHFKAIYTADKYQITYNLNGGLFTNISIVPFYFTYVDYLANGINIPEPVREGYTFLGWSNEVNKEPTKNPILENKNTNLLANWKKIETQNVYKIEYVINAADGRYTVVGDFIYEIYPGMPKTKLPEFNIKTRIYVGWKDVDGTIYKEVDDSITHDLILSPVTYSIDCTIAYVYSYRAEISSDPMIYKACSMLPEDIPLPKNVVREGSMFIGWRFYHDNTSPIFTDYLPKEYIVPGLIELETVFKDLTYTITYELNGGTFQNRAVPTTFDLYLIDSLDYLISMPVKQGHTFAGWTNANNPTPTLHPVFKCENTTLVANWK